LFVHFPQVLSKDKKTKLVGETPDIICQKQCDNLMELILCQEEKKASSASPQEKDELTKYLLCCFTTLDLYCQVSPSFAAAHASTLQPYLKTAVRFF
jgi:hypothetical protein